MRWKGCAFGLEGSSEIFGVFERGSIKLRENCCRAAIANGESFLVDLGDGFSVRSKVVDNWLVRLPVFQLASISLPLSAAAMTSAFK